MNKSSIAARLLILFASGGTLERVVGDLPMFREQIESVLGWMQSGGRCTAGVIAERGTRLREVVQRKHEAIQRQDFDVALKMRAEERRLFELFWLETPCDAANTILSVSIDEQIRDLAALFSEPTQPPMKVYQSNAN